MKAASALRFAIALAVALLAAGASHAQVFRAYLASDGSDANPCTLQLPCRLLPAAIAAVANGGEVWMLESANYNAGTVTIGKSVSILAVPGAVGSLVALNGGPAISITAASLTVALRNLVIGPVAGATPGTHGVHMTGASSLTVENSLIAGIPFNAIWVNGAGTLSVVDSTLRNNSAAIVLWNGARAVIGSSRLLGNYNGVVASGDVATSTTTASVSDCVISGSFVAIASDATVSTTSRVSVARSTIERNTYALAATTFNGGASQIEAGGNLIAENSFAWYQDGPGSTFLSLGTNQIGPAQPTFGMKTALPAQ